MKYYFAGKSKNQELKKSEKSNRSTRVFLMSALKWKKRNKNATNVKRERWLEIFVCIISQEEERIKSILDHTNQCKQKLSRSSKIHKVEGKSHSEGYRIHSRCFHAYFGM